MESASVSVPQNRAESRPQFWGLGTLFGDAERPRGGPVLHFLFSMMHFCAGRKILLSAPAGVPHFGVRGGLEKQNFASLGSPKNTKNLLPFFHERNRIFCAQCAKS